MLAAYSGCIAILASTPAVSYHGHQVWRVSYNASSPQDRAAVQAIHNLAAVKDEVDVWKHRIATPATLDIRLAPHLHEQAANLLKERQLAAKVHVADVNNCEHRYRDGTVPDLLPVEPAIIDTE